MCWDPDGYRRSATHASLLGFDGKWAIHPDQIAVANEVVYFTTLMSSKLMALDASTGKPLRAIQLPPVWSGPAVSRGRVYVGTGNIVLPDMNFSTGPSQSMGTLFSFGLPGEDEVSRMGGGKE